MSWKQTFNYDRFGNRTFDAGNTTTIINSKATNPVTQTADNRIKKDQDNDSINDYDYDANGSLKLDADNQRYVFDAENRIKEFFNSANSTTNNPNAVYEYDGEGKRVRKINDGKETIFVYNAGGTLVAEYSTELNPTPKVSYLTSDHLGSPRIITDEAGAVISRHDYMAFGDEVSQKLGNVGGRTSAQGYGTADDVRKQYTGYERDKESGLDYAQARYYNSNHGRFTSVDPLTASANIRNPQTFNRYSYVLNSPYKFTDPLGLLPQGTRSSDGGCSAEYSSCSDEMPDPWEGREEVPEQQETEEGVAANHEAGHAAQQQEAEEPPPPPTISEQTESENENTTLVSDDTIILAIAESGAGDHNLGSNLNRAAYTRGAELESQGFKVSYWLVHDIQGFQDLLDAASQTVVPIIG